MQDVLVSIILPVYNGEEFIVRSINSVLNQTHSNIELIVVNDGSIDGTDNMILNIKKNEPRIKYYKIQNSGVSGARNVGLRNATGKYVGFIDADDYIDDTMIETLLKKAEKYNCDIVSCIYERKYPDSNTKEEVKIKSGYYDKEDLENHVYPYFYGNKHDNYVLPLNIVTKLFKRNIIKEHSLKFEEEVKFGEDLIFTRNFLLLSDSFYFIDNLSLYNYVYNEKSATSDYYPNKWHELRKSILARKKIVDEYPKYKLEQPFNYTVLNSSINAVLNVFKNENHHKASMKEEIAQIVEDPLVSSALENIQFNNLTKKDKFLAYLIKWKKTNTIYTILRFNDLLIK